MPQIEFENNPKYSYRKLTKNDYSPLQTALKG